jgi:hypothetical protein
LGRTVRLRASRGRRCCGSKKTNKTTLRSEWRGLQKRKEICLKKSKKALTGPTFLEMSDFATYQDLVGVLSGAWSGITVPSHAPNDPNFRQKLFIWRQGYVSQRLSDSGVVLYASRLPRDSKTDVYTLFSQQSSRNS